MTFKMVNAHYRYGQGETKRCRHGRTDQQGSGEPGSLRVSDAAKVGHALPVLTEQCLNHRQQAPNVITRSQFRHDSAILRVQRHLGMNAVAKQPGVGVIQGDAGFVTRGFNSKYKHFRGGRCGCCRGIPL